MAWLSGLADRAEDILNRMDRNAAAVLVQPPVKEVLCENTMEKSGSEQLEDLVVLSIEQELTDQDGIGNQELAATKAILQNTARERDDLKTEVNNLLDHIHNRSTDIQEMSELRETNCRLTDAHRELGSQCERQLQSISALQLNLSTVREHLDAHGREKLGPIKS